MNAKQMLQAAGFPDTKKGRADFYKQYPTKEAFMMKFGGQYLQKGGQSIPYNLSSSPLKNASDSAKFKDDYLVTKYLIENQIGPTSGAYDASRWIAQDFLPEYRPGKKAAFQEYEANRKPMELSNKKVLSLAKDMKNLSADDDDYVSKSIRDMYKSLTPTDKKRVDEMMKLEYAKGGQATASNFFTFGQEPNYPVAFYADGGPTDPWLASRNPTIPANAKQVNAKDLGLRVNPNTKTIYLDQKGYPADSVVANPVDPKLALYYTHGKGVMGPSMPQYMNYANQWNNQNAQYFLDKNKNFYPTYGGDPKFMTKKHGGEPCFECGGQHMQGGGQNTSDIDNAVNAHKQSFMDYIQKNVQAAMQKQMMEQMMMGTHIEMPFELPKHQYGPPPIGDERQKLVYAMGSNPGMGMTSPVSYMDPNENDSRQYAGNFNMINNIVNSGYGPGYVDPNQKPALQKTPIDMNNIVTQGDNAPSVLDGTYSFMTKNAINPVLDAYPTNAYGDFVAEANADNAKSAPMAPTAAGDYDIRTGTSSDGKAYEVNDNVQQGELQPGRGNKLNPYNLLLGARVGERIFSADEIANEEDALARNFSINKTAMIRPSGEKGNHVVNTPNGVHLRPNATGAKVDPWGQANRKGQIGNPYYTAQYGGEQEGGEVEMTDAEIMQFLAMGGQLEILE